MVATASRGGGPAPAGRSESGGQRALSRRAGGGGSCQVVAGIDGAPRSAGEGARRRQPQAARLEPTGRRRRGVVGGGGASGVHGGWAAESGCGRGPLRQGGQRRGRAEAARGPRQPPV